MPSHLPDIINWKNVEDHHLWDPPGTSAHHEESYAVCRDDHDIAALILDPSVDREHGFLYCEVRPLHIFHCFMRNRGEIFNLTITLPY